MTNRRRKDDPLIDEIKQDVKEIKRMLVGNGDIGVCAQVKINEEHINEIKKRPSAIRGWIVAGAVIIGNIVISIFTRG